MKTLNLLILFFFLATLFSRIYVVNAALGIDGVANSLNGGGTPLSSFPLTTTQTNDIIIVSILANDGNQPTITDSNSLNWNYRTCNCLGNYADSVFYLYEFWALSPNALGGDIITATVGGDNENNHMSMVVFGVSGANTVTPFDNNALIPSNAQDSSSVTAFSVNVDTNNANDMIIGEFAVNGGDSASGFIPMNNFSIITQNVISGVWNIGATNYIVSGTQSGLPVGITWSNSGFVTEIADALIASTTITTSTSSSTSTTSTSTSTTSTTSTSTSTSTTSTSTSTSSTSVTTLASTIFPLIAGGNFTIGNNPFNIFLFTFGIPLIFYILMIGVWWIVYVRTRNVSTAFFWTALVGYAIYILSPTSEHLFVAGFATIMYVITFVFLLRRNRDKQGGTPPNGAYGVVYTH